jgi:pyruvate/2-oxoglutarate dehydrogenase complex dihydrolipoamide dehydrogenase (E3) component
MHDTQRVGDSYDFVVIGAGAAGEAAANMAASRGASVAVVERELVGGSCAFWACMPSKTLLHDAGIHALGGDRSWRAASERRDWVINRERIDWPDDGSHVERLEQAGAVVVRGDARIVGRGRIHVVGQEAERTIEARHVIVAVGTNSTVPPIDGLDEAKAWTNRQATSARELPRSLVILGGGPTGVELAQVYGRFGVPVTLIHANGRLNDRDHPRNSEVAEAALRRDGVEVVTGVRAERVQAGRGADGAHRIGLTGGRWVEGHEIVLAIGRSVPLDGLGLESAGAELRNGSLPRDGNLKLADGLWVVGDPAGPEMHTHVAHYQGELAVRMALGDEVTPDYRAIPRVLYTDPETAGVGMTVGQAREVGQDPVELTQDLAETARGYVAEATGHVTIVVDRASRELVGAFIAGPGASETIHEAVLAIKTHTTIDVLADTLHAFPTTARVLGTLFGRAAREI